MNFKTIPQFLTAILLVLSFTSCSNDSENENTSPDGFDLIIGEWLFVSENDYRCGTNIVANERLAADNGYDQTFVFKSDMTYESYDDGVLNDAEDQMGTWENIGDGFYTLSFTVFGEPRSSSIEVEFLNNNIVMNFGIDDECRGVGEESTYTYTVWTRQ